MLPVVKGTLTSSRVDPGRPSPPRSTTTSIDFPRRRRQSAAVLRRSSSYRNPCLKKLRQQPRQNLLHSETRRPECSPRGVGFYDDLTVARWLPEPLIRTKRRPETGPSARQRLSRRLSSCSLNDQPTCYKRRETESAYSPSTLLSCTYNLDVNCVIVLLRSWLQLAHSVLDDCYRSYIYIYIYIYSERACDVRPSAGKPTDNHSNTNCRAAVIDRNSCTTLVAALGNECSRTVSRERACVCRVAGTVPPRPYRQGTAQ